MDLELTDEQTWLSGSVETLLAREAEPWAALVEFGALSRDLGAVELCLVARALGAGLASVPYLGSAAARYAGVRPARDAATVTIALLEPGCGWDAARVATTVDDEPAAGGTAGGEDAGGEDAGTGEVAAGGSVTGAKAAVEHACTADFIAVVAGRRGETVLALVPRDADGVSVAPRPGLDATVPMGAVTFDHAPADTVTDGVERVLAAGSLLAAAEAVGAAGQMLEDARAYAIERRQFGRAIGSFQAVKHILADMYVRHSSAWSTVLYAAATLDGGGEDAARTASIAKAYVSRAAREVAHGAMQVFGGIAFTAEHPAHRYLRRIVVREQQFGDAAHHERALGRALALRSAA